MTYITLSGILGKLVIRIIRMMGFGFSNFKHTKNVVESNSYFTVYMKPSTKINIK